MKTILMTVNPDLDRDIELLRRQDITLVVVRSLGEFQDRLHQGVDLCLLARVEWLTAALQALRGDRRTAHVPAVLVVARHEPPVEPALREAFDEVLELPAPPAALELLLSRLTGLPLREGERFPVRVHVFSASPAESAPRAPGEAPAEYLGTTLDLSEVGMLLQLRRPLPLGERLLVRFALPGQTGFVDLRARVVRVDERAPAGEPAVGLCFESPGQAAKEQLRGYLRALIASRPLRWRMVTEGDRYVITLAGVLRADPTLLQLRLLRGEIEFRLRDFRRISSDSIQIWLDLIRSLTGAAKIRLRECPIAFIQQANAISNLLDNTEVASFYAPYVCPRCGLDEERLIDVARDLVPHWPGGQRPASITPPAFPCASCGTPLEFDDLAERYFAFLS